MRTATAGVRTVILAGGRGTRLAPFTTVFPKPLMPLGEEPITGVLLRQLASEGLVDVTLAVGYLADLITTYCGDGSRFGVRLTYSHEMAPLGTVGPLAMVDGLDETFLVMNGDLLTTLSFRSFLDSHRRAGALLTLGSVRRDVQLEFGILELRPDGDGGGRVIGMREKPLIEAVVSMGVYAMEPAILGYVEPGQPLDLPDLVLRLLAAGEPVAAQPFDGYWLDIGRHSDYQRACDDFAGIRGQLVGESSAWAGPKQPSDSSSAARTAGGLR